MWAEGVASASGSGGDQWSGFVGEKIPEGVVGSGLHSDAQWRSVERGVEFVYRAARANKVFSRSALSAALVSSTDATPATATALGAVWESATGGGEGAKPAAAGSEAAGHLVSLGWRLAVAVAANSAPGTSLAVPIVSLTWTVRGDHAGDWDRARGFPDPVGGSGASSDRVLSTELSLDEFRALRGELQAAYDALDRL